MTAGLRRVRTLFRCALCVLGAAMLLPSPALAHLMPAGNSTIRIVGDSAFALIAIPTSSLSGFDDDGDRLLSLNELNAHRTSLSQQVSKMIDLRAGAQPGRLVFEDLLMSHVNGSETKPADHVVAMRRYQWNGPVQSFTLAVGLFEHETAREAQLAVRAASGERTEVAVLTRHRNTYEFFAGPWATLRSFIMAGTEHILLGADHLVFLLTLLVAGAGAGWMIERTLV